MPPQIHLENIKQQKLMLDKERASQSKLKIRVRNANDESYLLCVDFTRGLPQALELF